MQVSGKLISDISLSGGGIIARQHLKLHDGDKATIELSIREFLEQLTHKQVGELLEMINLPQQAKPEINSKDGSCYNCGQKWSNHDPEKCKAKSNVQGVVTRINFPLGEDEMAISKAITSVLRDGWVFSELTKTHISFDNKWEVNLNQRFLEQTPPTQDFCSCPIPQFTGTSGGYAIIICGRCSNPIKQEKKVLPEKFV